MSLAGSVESFPLTAVASLLEAISADGVLRLAGPAGPAALHVAGGALVGWEPGDTTDAVDVVAGLLDTAGTSFRWDPESVPERRGIAVDLDDLMVRAGRRAAELGEMKRVAPSPSCRLTLLTDGVTDGIVLEPTQWRAVCAIGDGCTLTELAERLPASPLETHRLVGSLLGAGLVTVGDPAQPGPDVGEPAVHAAPGPIPDRTAPDEQVILSFTPGSAYPDLAVPGLLEPAHPPEAAADDVAGLPQAPPDIDGDDLLDAAGTEPAAAGTDIPDEAPTLHPPAWELPRRPVQPGAPGGAGGRLPTSLDVHSLLASLGEAPANPVSANPVSASPASATPVPADAAVAALPGPVPGGDPDEQGLDDRGPWPSDELLALVDQVASEVDQGDGSAREDPSGVASEAEGGSVGSAEEPSGDRSRAARAVERGALLRFFSSTRS